MTLKEHYKYHSRKSLKPYMRLLLLFTIVIVCSSTISRYTSGATVDGLINIAKWSIIINGVEITNTSNQLDMNIDLFNVKDDKTNISLGDECYFDITLNPMTTEVAISYTIDINLENSNLPNGSIIEKYQKYVNTEENETISKTEDNINETNISLTERIYLPENEISLDNTSARRYRVYCKLPSTAESTETAEIYINPQITVKQLIED